MKKCNLVLVFVSVCLGLFVSCGNKTENTYSLKGNIQDLEDGKIFLVERINKTYVPIAETDVINGKFKFNGSVPEPKQVFLADKDTLRFYSFFIENADLTIEGSRQEQSTLKVIGSPINDLYVSYKNEYNKVEEEEDSIMAKFNEAKMSGDTDKADMYSEQLALTEKMYKNLVDKYVSGNPNSVVAPYLLYSNMFYYNADELASYCGSFGCDAVKTSYYKDLNSYIEKMKKVDIGQPFVDFTMNDVEDNPVRLSDFAGKGYLLVDFWASWCPYCRIENPNLVKMYDKYHDKGFDIVGVSLDSSKDQWVKAIEDDKLTWHHVSDLLRWDNAAAALYVVRAIPSNVLIDPNGIIIAKNLTGKDLALKLEELIK